MLVALMAMWAAEGTAELRGCVVDQQNRPLRGARVVVQATDPAEPNGEFVGEGHPNLGRFAIADERGEFVLNGLQPRTLVQLLASHPRCKALVGGFRNPAMGIATVPLARHEFDEQPNDRVCRVKVVDEQRLPIAGAAFRTKGYQKGESNVCGTSAKIDPHAVSDAEGRFALGIGDPEQRPLGVLSAPGFASKYVSPIKSGAEVAIMLDRGAAVTGALRKNGNPIADAVLCLVQEDRLSMTFLGPVYARTAADGAFRFPHVAAGRKCLLSGVMASLRDRGAVPPREVKVGAPETVVNLREIEVEPAFEVSGRVRLASGDPLPEKAEIGLGVEDGWDTRRLALRPNGRFVFEGVPRGVCYVRVTANGHRLSSKNLSLSAENLLYGKIDRDVERLTLLLEPEPKGENESPSDENRELQLRAEPLRGAPDE